MKRVAPHYAELFALDPTSKAMSDSFTEYARGQMRERGRVLPSSDLTLAANMLMVRFYMEKLGRSFLDAVKFTERAMLYQVFSSSPMILQFDEHLLRAFDLQEGTSELPIAMLGRLPYSCLFAEGIRVSEHSKGLFVFNYRGTVHVVELMRDPKDGSLMTDALLGIDLSKDEGTFGDALKTSYEMFLQQGFTMGYEEYEKLAEPAIAAIAYLCSSEPDIRIEYSPGERLSCAKENRKKKRSRAFRAKVGSVIGSTLRLQAADAENPRPVGSARTVSPHIRRAHWHKFWCGSVGGPDRRLEVRLIPPTYVGSERQSSITRKVS